MTLVLDRTDYYQPSKKKKKDTRLNKTVYLIIGSKYQKEEENYCVVESGIWELNTKYKKVVVLQSSNPQRKGNIWIRYRKPKKF